MEFLFGKGFDIAGAATLLRKECLEQFRDGHTVLTSGGIDIFVNEQLQQRKLLERGVITFFDGQFSHRGKFFHALLENDARAVEEFSSDLFIDGRPAPCNGIFCVVRVSLAGVGCAGRVYVCTDALGQYPVYLHQMADRYLVSNSVGLIECMLTASATPCSRSLWPSIENLVLGGVISERTQLEGVQRLPFGSRIVAAESLHIERSREEDTSDISYSDALEMAHRSIESHLEAVTQRLGRDGHFVVDVTGGSDSRAALSFLLSSNYRSKLHARCYTEYPNPDANVAGLLMSRYGILPGATPVVAASVEQAVRLNSHLWGGAREPGLLLWPTAFPDYVQFSGFYGELGGVTSGTDYIAAAAKQPKGYSAGAAVDLLVKQRARTGALSLLLPDCIEVIRTQVAASLQEAEARGVERDQLIPEMDLRGRWRTHFGLMSMLENRVKIRPELLANRWIVIARRRLPRELHTKNKLIFDLVLKNGGAELAFAPMAWSKWDRSVVPGEFASAWLAMKAVTTNDECLSHHSGALMLPFNLPVSWPSEPILPFESREQPVFPFQRFIKPYQMMLQHLLDEYDANCEVWRFYDRAAIGHAVAKQVDEFHPLGFDTHAMGIALAGIMWVLRLDMCPRIQARQRFGELLQAG